MQNTALPKAQALRIADYSYPLPADRIASRPCAPRDACRLLACSPQGDLTDHTFTDLTRLLPSNTLLVLNDTGVIQARLHFQKTTGARIEIMLISPQEGMPVEQALMAKNESCWQCLVGNAKRWQQGTIHRELTNGLRIEAERLLSTDGLGSLVRFRWPGSCTFGEWLATAGETPIPPYMHRESIQEDSEWYQTVYAAHSGSVAAPTAGLHFTQNLLNGIAQTGVKLSWLTLHVSAGTFLPVTSETLGGHRMHREPIIASRELLMRLSQHQGPITAVGTTSLRTLESLYWLGYQLLKSPNRESSVRNQPLYLPQWSGYMPEDTPLPNRSECMRALLELLDQHGEQNLRAYTELLISPGYRIRMAEGLITNFHQPESTLLLLVDAFMGQRELWRRAYQHAMEHEYSFLSYGDAMYIKGKIF